MKKVILQSGLIAHFYSDAEQAATWKELNVDLSVIGKNEPLYTPRDEKEYFIDSVEKLGTDKYRQEIRANGKTIFIKGDICKLQEKQYAAVRKLYA